MLGEIRAASRGFKTLARKVRMIKYQLVLFNCR
jgi:hypothetical protein